MKVLLILSDGMRPDGLEGHPAVARLMREGSYSLRARTVMPSVTLPCHMSLFHSVDPGRHGDSDQYLCAAGTSPWRAVRVSACKREYDCNVL